MFAAFLQSTCGASVFLLSREILKYISPQPNVIWCHLLAQDFASRFGTVEYLCMMVALLTDADPSVTEFVRRSLFEEATTAEQVRDRYAAFELFVARICRLCWYVHSFCWSSSVGHEMAFKMRTNKWSCVHLLMLTTIFIPFREVCCLAPASIGLRNSPLVLLDPPRLTFTINEFVMLHATFTNCIRSVFDVMPSDVRDTGA